MDFVIGGIAAVCAGCFTNPLEVIKTRIQLQGELRKKGKHFIHYRNVIHASCQIIKHDGLFALQKGIIPALWVQFIMNGSRLGFYDYGFSHGFYNNSTGETVFYKSVFISGCGGIIGHYLSNPFYLIKTHLQSESAKAIAVGYQHYHEGTWKALINIYRNEGFRGLFRGGVAAIPRAFVASSSQLMSFVYCKEWLSGKRYYNEHAIITCFISSMVGGVAISVITAPFDLILVRLYNQGITASGEGLYYKGYFDCVRKIYQTEGITAFYKGVAPLYFRLGPHSVLCLMFWDILKGLCSSS